MNKKLYVLGLLLVAISVKGMAQTGPVFQLNKLSSEDTLLSGWKFHAGDDPEWAKTGFDDSKWKATDPGQDITDFSELKSSGIRLDQAAYQDGQQPGKPANHRLGFAIHRFGNICKRQACKEIWNYRTQAICDTCPLPFAGIDQFKPKARGRPGDSRTAWLSIRYSLYISFFYTVVGI